MFIHAEEVHLQALDLGIGTWTVIVAHTMLYIQGPGQYMRVST